MPKAQNNNLKTLRSQLINELKKISVENNELAKDIAFKVMRNVTGGTVVDTSKAVSNWVATLDKPHDGEIEAHVKGKGGSTEGESIEIAILRSNNAITSKKSGQPLFVVNDINGNAYQRRARVKEASEEAMTEAIIEVAKADAIIGDIK